MTASRDPAQPTSDAPAHADPRAPGPHPHAAMSPAEARLRAIIDSVLADVVGQSLQVQGVPAASWGVLSRFLHRAEEIAAASLCAARREAAATDTDATDPSRPRAAPGTPPHP